MYDRFEVDFFEYMKIILLAIFICLAGTAWSQPMDEGLQSFSGNWLNAYEATASGDLATSPADGREKSGFLGVVYSSLLPGMGELYAGRFDRGLYNLVTDLVLWGGFAGFNISAGWIRGNARSFAVQKAGISLDGKDEEYFINIGNYRSIREYNDQKLLERQLNRLYNESPEAGLAWNWDSEEDMREYRDSRLKSEDLYTYAQITVLGLVLNRIWSAVQAAIFVRDHNESLAPETAGFSIHPRLISSRKGIDGFGITFFSWF